MDDRELQSLIEQYEFARSKMNTMYDLYKNARAIADSLKSQILEIEELNKLKKEEKNE